MLIKIAVAEDFGLVRREILHLLNALENIEVVLEASTGQDLLAFLTANPVDVVLIDCDLADLGGAKACQIIKDQNLDVPVIMLSTHQDKKMLNQAVQAGARGFLFKNSSLGEYHNAIMRVHQGGSYFSADVVDDLLKPE